MRVADYIFEVLAGHGVGHVFLVPGGGAMHLVDAAGRNTAIEYVATHHEQAAAISAEAYSRIPGCLGCALVTTGPGVTNAITGVAGAWIDSVPMVVISGQVKRADLMTGTGLRQVGPQEVDVQAIAGGITKYCVTLKTPEEVRSVLEEALHLATSGRPGPVWIDVPLDIQGAEIDPQALPGFTAPPAEKGYAGEDLDVLIDAVRNAERPLILAGHGIRLAGAEATFKALVEVLKVPVVATWNAMDLLASDNPLYVGKPGTVALRAPNFAVQSCDLLIALGARLDNVVTAFDPAGFARNGRKIMVNVDPAEITKMGDAVTHGIVADLGPLLQDWLARTSNEPPERADWLENCQSLKQRFGIEYGSNSRGANEPISHYEFVDSLSEAAPADTLISTGSSGLAIEVFYEVFRVKQGQRVFLTSGLGAMGYGLPAAIGACVANGGKPMIALESDGSLQLNLQEFNTLKALNLPMHLIVMNNKGYASIRTTQRNYFEGRFVGTGPEANLFLPDLEKVAAVYDFPYVRIENRETMTQQLTTMIDMPGPVICEVMLSPQEVLLPKVSAIVQDNGAITSMPLEDMTPLLPLAELDDIMQGKLTETSRNANRE